MNNNQFVAITIGPIFDTMNLVSSPAALWASSYIFSSVAKEICRLLTTEYGISEEQIITPYYNADTVENDQTDGVGLYPDHIIFQQPENFEISKISEIKGKVIDYLRKSFFADLTVKDSKGNEHVFSFEKDEIRKYFDEYLMIAAVQFQIEDPGEEEQALSQKEKEDRRKNSNPILKSSKMLDCLELAKLFVRLEKKNYILERFTGEERDETNVRIPSGKNELIKQVVKNLGINNWQLLSGGKIKDLPAIACVDNTDRKYNDYCVIVRADGDNIGQIISRLKTEEIREFSKCCLTYCKAASDLVKRYGGVTIYSGGDDLLALLPCKNKTEQNKTVINFASELSAVFDKCFSTYKDALEKENESIREKNKTAKPEDIEEEVHIPSLSVAALIFYKKFPLYEAVERSASLLFDTAKSKKNCLVISLQKHSGQSVELIIPSTVYNSVIELQNVILGCGTDKNSEDKRETLILSALHKISMFSSLLNVAADDEQIQNLFNNLFDAASHEGNDFVHKTLPKYYNIFRGEGNLIVSDQTGPGFADDFSALLRLMKFFTEKGGRKAEKKGATKDGNV